MNLEQLDDLLRRYTEAEQRIATTLVELEARPTYTLITGGPLQGTTAERLRGALTAAPELWRAFDSFREVLDKARIVRGAGRRIDDDDRQQLEALLAGPSILIDAEQIPVEQRTLLGAAEKETRVTPEQLLAQMSATFDIVRQGVVAVDQVWRDVVPRIDRATTACTRLEQVAATIGSPDEPALASLRDAIHAVEGTLAQDPLGVEPTAIERLDAAVAIAEARVAALTAGRSSLARDLDRATAMIVAMRRTQAEAVAAGAEAAVKISAATVVQPPPQALIDSPDGLASALGEVRAVADWQMQRRRLDAWFARAEPLAHELDHALATNRAPLARRDELRGLLASYRAKAGDVGVAEDPRIAALTRAAHQQLHTAPTDLARAEQLIAELAVALRRPGAT